MDNRYLSPSQATPPASSRLVSSTVLREEYMQEFPRENARYVEVPVIEEIVRHVPRPQFVEIEKRVPRYEYKYVDKIVEIPEVEYVDRTIEVPVPEERLRYVPKKQIVDVPREEIKTVPRIETRRIEKKIEVPGEVIEIPRPYEVRRNVPAPRFIPREVPIIVAQNLRPVVRNSDKVYSVGVTHYRPRILEIEIPVPKVVDNPIIANGVRRLRHQRVEVPPSQYNSMIKMLNPQLSDTQLFASKFFQTLDGSGNVSFLPVGQPVPVYPCPAEGLSLNYDDECPDPAGHHLSHSEYRRNKSGRQKSSRCGGWTTPFACHPQP